MYLGISQSYMTGLGLSELGCKDKFAKNFNEYSAKYNSTPSCFESEDFFPKSFVLRGNLIIPLEG